MFLKTLPSTNLISLPTPSIKNVIAFLVVPTLITPLLPPVVVIVTVPGYTPSSSESKVFSTPVICPLPPMLETFPITLLPIKILSLTAYPVPAVDIVNESTV